MSNFRKRLVRSLSSKLDFIVEKLRKLECEGDIDLAHGLKIASVH